jgi:hypothetical protein
MTTIEFEKILLDSGFYKEDRLSNSNEHYYGYSSSPISAFITTRGENDMSYQINPLVGKDNKGLLRPSHVNFISVLTLLEEAGIVLNRSRYYGK